MSTKIEWCSETINPIQDARKGKSGRGYHCTKVSPGCLNCYAERINKIRGNSLPFDSSPCEFELIESELNKLFKWKKPRSVFVQSMGDLFHENISRIDREEIFIAMDENDRHTYLLLTKRPERMAEFLDWDPWIESIWPNFYLGLTVCNQQEADEKIPVFLKVPGEKFLSIEPMLGPINLYLDEKKVDCGGCSATPVRGQPYCPGHYVPEIDAVILGGETGPGARPSHPDTFRADRDQCEAAGVDFFFKGWGEWLPGIQHFYEFKQIRGTVYETEPIRVGKKKAGRGLDGRTHDDLPWDVKQI